MSGRPGREDAWGADRIKLRAGAAPNSLPNPKPKLTDGQIGLTTAETPMLHTLYVAAHTPGGTYRAMVGVGYAGRTVASGGSKPLILVRQIARIHKGKTLG
jgi:hypothetical protein